MLFSNRCPAKSNIFVALPCVPWIYNDMNMNIFFFGTRNMNLMLVIHVCICYEWTILQENIEDVEGWMHNELQAYVNMSDQQYHRSISCYNEKETVESVSDIYIYYYIWWSAQKLHFHFQSKSHVMELFWLDALSMSIAVTLFFYPLEKS